MDKTILNDILKKIIDKEPELPELEKAYHVIKAGADPNTKNEIGETILFPVVKTKEITLMEKFVEAGCDINVKNIRNYKPFDVAICENAKDVVAWFLENGFEVNELLYLTHGDWTGNRLQLLCKGFYSNNEEKENIIDTTKVLIKYGIDLLERDSDDNLALDILNCYNNNESSKLYQFLKNETEKAQKLFDIKHPKTSHNKQVDLVSNVDESDSNLISNRQEVQKEEQREGSEDNELEILRWRIRFLELMKQGKIVLLEDPYEKTKLIIKMVKQWGFPMLSFSKEQMRSYDYLLSLSPFKFRDQDIKSMKWTLTFKESEKEREKKSQKDLISEKRKGYDTIKKEVEELTEVKKKLEVEISVLKYQKDFYNRKFIEIGEILENIVETTTNN